MPSQAEFDNDYTKKDTPNWRASGDWFNVCKCNIPCPCTFAQTPTYGDCDGIMAYHIKEGNYGEVSLSGLNVLVLDSFKGNVWAGDGTTKVNVAIFFDEKASEQQRNALNMIFSGRAGGFMAEFAKLLGEVRGIEYSPIKFEIADDLSYWSAEMPGKIVAKAEALTGPTTLRVNGFKPLTRLAVRWVLGQLLHGASPSWIKLMQWVSNGREMAGQASISHLIGGVHRRLLLTAGEDKGINVI